MASDNSRGESRDADVAIMGDYSSLIARFLAFEISSSAWQAEADALNAIREENNAEIRSNASAIAQFISTLAPRIENLTASHSSFVTECESELDEVSRATDERISLCVNTATNLFGLFSSLPDLQRDAEKVPDMLTSLETNLIQALNDTQNAAQAAQGAFALQCNGTAASYRSALADTAASIEAFKTALASAADTIDSQINVTIPASVVSARNAARTTMMTTSELVIQDIRGHAMQAIAAVDTDVQHAVDEAIKALSDAIDQFVSGAAGGSGPVDARANALIADVASIMDLIPQVVQEALAVPPRVAAKLATFGAF